MRKSVAWLGLMVGIVALVLQFFISMERYIEIGVGIPMGLWAFFSYFTILTNITVVLIYFGAVVRGKAWLALFRKPITRAAAAAAITLVMGFYHFFLANIWEPEGLFWVCDVALHYVAPIIYLIWFSLFNRSGTLKWSALPGILLAPLIYLISIMARGAMIDEYPYPVLEANRLGYAAVGVNILMLLVTLAVLGLIAIAVDRAVLVGSRRT